MPTSLIRKIYILVTLIFTVLLFVFGWINFQDHKELIIKENTATLLNITNILEQRLPNSYEKMLEQESIEKIDDKGKAIILNKKLQPIIDEVALMYPECGMGYGLYRQLIAFHPFDEENFDKRTSDIAMRVYKTKTSSVIYNSSAAVWGGQPTLSVNYPLYVNGEIIGHAWANMKLDNINQQIAMALGRNALVLIAAWLLLLLLLKWMFKQIESRLSEFAVQATEHDFDKSLIRVFPELETLQQFVSEKIEEMVSNRLILDTITDALIIFDKQLNILFINQAAKHMFNLMEEAIGQKFAIALPYANPIFQEEFLKSIKSNQSKIFRAECYCTGNWSEASVYPAKFGLITCFRDISETKKMEQELQRLDILNIVGEMAASIGHEVRNPMTTVRGYLQLFLKREKFVEYTEQIKTMVEELDRANAIITEFLSLAKNKAVELLPGNLNGTIHALYPLLQAEAFRLGHQIHADIGDIPPLRYDDKEMRQLILNLARNGMEAMEAGGMLTIKTYIDCDKIILAVQDTGKGMPKEILDRIGTPFRTTKESGTGLGLSVCYKIAERHNAKIEVDSSSKGTNFFVQFAAEGGC